MNIMIVGCGRVGSQLALILSREGHNVTIIDENQEALKRLGPAFNGMAAVGSGFNEKLLTELKVQKQDAFVVVTDNDNTNLMVSQIAKKIFKVPKVMARVYDPSRADIYKKLGLDIISGTTLVAAMIRDKIIENRFTAYLIETGELGVLEVMIGEEFKYKKIEALNVPGEFMAVAIERGGRPFIPQPGATLHGGDKVMGVVRIGSLKKIKEMFKI